MVTQLFEQALDWATRVNSLQRAPEQISSPHPKWRCTKPTELAVTYNSRVKHTFLRTSIYNNIHTGNLNCIQLCKNKHFYLAT